MMRVSETVKHLIIINVIFFLASMALGAPFYQKMALFFPENPNFRFWQFVTHMFMHGGMMHILFNMYGLWAFGSPLEYLWGGKRFLVFYFAAGLGAGIIYTLVNYFQFHSIYEQLIALGLSPGDIQHILETGKYSSSLDQVLSEGQISNLYTIYHSPAVGASGALYGILVAFAFKYPDSELMLIFVPYPIKAKYFIPILVGLDLFSGVTGFSIFGGGIAHFAHVGGALIGYLLMKYYQHRPAYHEW